MWVNDRERNGYQPLREHDTRQAPEFRNVQGLRVIEQPDSGSYADGVGDFGDCTSWFYWDFEQEQFVEAQGPTESDNDPPASRDLEPSDYMRSGNPSNPMPLLPERRVGSWSQGTLSVRRDGDNIEPIRSKLGGQDKTFKPKILKLSGFVEHRDEVKTVTGAPIARGFPGEVKQTISQEEYELLFVPAGGMLAVDNKTDEGMSSRVFDVKADGFLDTSGKEVAGLHSAWSVEEDENGAKTVAIQGTKSGVDETGFGAITLADDEGEKKLCYLSSEKGGPLTAGATEDKHELSPGVQPAHIHTDQARYFKTPQKDAPLLFTNDPFLIEEGVTVEGRIAHDPVTDFWRIVVPIDDEVVTTFARVRWNFQVSGDGLIEDLSEGEVSDIDGVSAPGSQRIWVDYALSSGVFFNTLGDGAVFLMKIVAKDVDRLGIVRDLFRVESVLLDKGVPVDFFEVVDLDTLLARPLFGDKPWLDPLNAGIDTTIAGQELENRMPVQLTRQWSLAAGNYRFLETSDVSRGTDFFASPIEPTPSDNEFIGVGSMESAQTFENGVTIATYQAN